MADEAARYASEPGLACLLDEAAQRYRALGRVAGTVRLERLTGAEARALHHLSVTGRAFPRAGGDAKLDLRRLDRALADAGGLLAVLHAAGHDLTTADECRRADQAVRDAAWARSLDLVTDPRTAEWLAELRRARGGLPPADLHTVLAALALLDQGPEAWDRARLSIEVADHPHALDDDRPATTLLRAALAHREHIPVPGDAAGRRALLDRHGVVSDPHSSTVLVLGLRTGGSGPGAKQLAAADGGHVVLTLAQLTASVLRPVPRVRTCEGPVVLRAAEHALGAGPCDPLVCTDGQPSAACDALLRQLVGTVLHSGDFEWGGLRVAGVLRRRHGARSWRHGAADYEAALARMPDRTSLLDPPRGTAPEGMEAVWRRLAERRVPVWQEDLLEALLNDLAWG